MKTDVIREVTYKGWQLVHRSNVGLDEPGERLSRKTEWHVYPPQRREFPAIDIVYSLGAAKAAVDTILSEAS